MLQHFGLAGNNWRRGIGGSIPFTPLPVCAYLLYGPVDAGRITAWIAQSNRAGMRANDMLLDHIPHHRIHFRTVFWRKQSQIGNMPHIGDVEHAMMRRAIVTNKSGAIQVMPDGTIKIGSTKAIAIAAPNVTVGSAAQPLVTQAGLVAVLTAVASGMTAIGAGSLANGPAGATIVSAAIAALTTAPPNVTKSFQAS